MSILKMSISCQDHRVNSFRVKQEGQEVFASDRSFSDSNCVIWQKILANSITKPAELFSMLELDHTLLPASLKACLLFKLKVPSPFIQRMRMRDVSDPLLMQVLPVKQESEVISGFSCDPLLESNQIPVEGLIHKYKGRVLVMSSSVCAVNCRFCFRRHFSYEENQLNEKRLDDIVSYIGQDDSIKEVILSGGDPLILSDRRLSELIQCFARLAHVKTVRIHTRLPIMIPQRISDDLLHAVTHDRLKTVVVLHCNHGNEVDSAVKTACQKMARAGLTLLSQAVLLKGINDNATALLYLHERLFDCGVIPYYLHLLDKVQGAAHFDVMESSAKKIMSQLRALSPGYLVPRLVREIAGRPFKVPMAL